MALSSLVLGMWTIVEKICIKGLLILTSYADRYHTTKQFESTLWNYVWYYQIKQIKSEPIFH